MGWGQFLAQYAMDVGEEKSSMYPHADLSGPELTRRYEKNLKEGSQIGQEMIAAGRGYEKPSETRTKTDSLSQRSNANSDRHNSFVEEMRRRERFHGGNKPIPKPHRYSFYGGSY